MTEYPHSPPKLFLRFFRWFCHPDLEKYIEGDLMELYQERLENYGKRRADIKFVMDVLLLFRPGIIKPTTNNYHTNHLAMLSNYLKIGWRNLMRNKGYSILNISGLAAGMAVAVIIGLWIKNELSYDSFNPSYHRIAQVIQNVTNNNETDTWFNTPFPLGDELRNKYGDDFKYVVMSSGLYNGAMLGYDDRNYTKTGISIGPEGPNLLDLHMIEGSRNGLRGPSSIFLSESTAKTIFGNEDPMNKVLKVNNQSTVKVTGVYEDISRNSEFSQLAYLMPWEKFVKDNNLMQDDNPWRCNCDLTFVELNDHADFADVSEKIRDVKMHNVHQDELVHHPQLFLFPMDRWHLYREFKNGVNAGGRIQYVWMFGITGIFVLLLACINFMNLSTSRSEKRAKEVGIRKSVGSRRPQLIFQFFTESLLVSALAFTVSLLITSMVLPTFNAIADERLTVPWSNVYFWLAGAGFVFITGFVAGSYPALYLSSFRPVRILKGVIRTGRSAIQFRQMLVVLQFTISVVLIIGTIIVYKQVQFARNRPLGYDRDGLIMFYPPTSDFHQHFDAIKKELIDAGAITELAESGSSVTGVWSTNSGFDWQGKNPNEAVDFPNIEVSADYGKTVDWKFLQGRDFSRDFASDTSAFVINEAAARYIGLKDPVGETVRWDDQPFTVIGVIHDVIMESPYESVRPTFYHLLNGTGGVVVMKLSPEETAQESLNKIKSIYKKYIPGQPFEYEFVDDNFAKKFGDEVRIGKISTWFAGLAIFISCLGIFGLASYVAEQRTKEIGIRKILGASVAGIWQLLSKDFVRLVSLSCLLAIPLAWYFLRQWLMHYTYHTEVAWWVFAITAAGAILITLLTVSYQALKAATMDPVKSLRSE